MRRARPAIAAARVGALGALLLAAGCQSAPKARLLDMDFDGFAEWMRPAPAWLTAAKAHSGSYASIVPYNAPYGPSYQCTAARLASARKLRLGIWCWLPNGRTRLEAVFELAREGQPLLRQTLRVSEDVHRFGQWEPAVVEFNLPADLQPTDNVKLYVWQREENSEDSYFDDITLDKLK